MQTVELLFLIILVYFVANNNKVIGKNNEKSASSNSNSDSFSMKKSIEYLIHNSVKNPEKIVYIHEFMEAQTCISFSRVYDSSSTTATIIKMGTKCLATGEIINKTISYSISLTKDCIERNRLLKIILLSIDLRYQVSKCLENDKDYNTSGFIFENKMDDLLKNKNCKIIPLKEVNVEISKSSLNFSIKKGTKIDNATPVDVEQKDYYKEISFLDVKKLNDKICKDSCSHHSSIICKNYGYRNPKNCDKCICPFFYDGKNCEMYMKTIKFQPCGQLSLIATSRKNSKILDFQSECYYRIKPSLGNRNIKVNFVPSNSLKWDCKVDHLLEIKHYKDKSKVGVIPCGQIKEFSIKGSKGTTVLIYNKFIAKDFKIRMEYLTVKDRKSS